MTLRITKSWLEMKVLMEVWIYGHRRSRRSFVLLAADIWLLVKYLESYLRGDTNLFWFMGLS